MTKMDKVLGIERAAVIRRTPAPEPEKRPSRRNFSQLVPWEAWIRYYHWPGDNSYRTGRYAKEEYAVKAALKHMRWLRDLYRRPAGRQESQEWRGMAYVVQPDGSSYTPLDW